MADPGVREAAGRAEVVLAVGVRAPRAVEALAGAAPPGAVELAFDCDPALESRSRLQASQPPPRHPHRHMAMGGLTTYNADMFQYGKRIFIFSQKGLTSYLGPKGRTLGAYASSRGCLSINPTAGR